MSVRQTRKPLLNDPLFPRSLKAHFVFLSFLVLSPLHHDLLRFVCVHLSIISSELKTIDIIITRALTKCNLDRSYRSRDLINRTIVLNSKRESCRYVINARLETKILNKNLLRSSTLLLHEIIKQSRRLQLIWIVNVDSIYRDNDRRVQHCLNEIIRLKRYIQVNSSLLKE